VPRQVLTGIAWHIGSWALPASFPLWRTVYGGFRRWIKRRLFVSPMLAHKRQVRAALWTSRVGLTS
jgi:putative transposase